MRRMFNDSLKDMKESARTTHINFISNITLSVYEYILDAGEDEVIKEILKNDIENDSFRACFPNVYRRIHERNRLAV